MKRTVEFYNRKEQAEKALKKYGKGYVVRQHPKWKTWDVAKVIRKKPKQNSLFGKKGLF